MMRRASLQTRLTVLVVLALTVFGAFAGYQSHRIARNEADEMFDAQLAQMGQSLLSIGNGYIVTEDMEHDLDDHYHDVPQPLPNTGHPYQHELIFQMWRVEGEALLLRSTNTPQATISPLPPTGFSNGTWEGRTFRFYRKRQGELEVLVGESDKARVEIANEVAEHNLVPFLWGLPLLALGSLLVIRLSLRPLRNLAREVASRSPSRLEPVEIGDLPAELRPLVERLNQFLQRLSTALDHERRFTADAAHELRTPLAALRAQAESALLGESPADVRRSLDRVLVGTTRLEHLVSQLLTLARLEGRDHALKLEPVNLNRLAEDICADVGGSALAHRQDLSLTTEGRPMVNGQPQLLGALIRNLVDNALRYTPEGGSVAVSISSEENRVRLVVADDGPGVPADELSRLGERFHRLNPSRTEGAGLGISIVRRIAEIHGAQISFADARPQSGGNKGLAVSVSLPLLEA